MDMFLSVNHHYQCMNHISVCYDSGEWLLCENWCIEITTEDHHSDLDILIAYKTTIICTSEMAVRYAALSACRKVHVYHCNSLGGAT